jgi:Raf kinase inhibitor-like YbhB/YbcL family protein
MAFELRSSAFQTGKAIPSRYTCDGEDVSPPLEWAGVPAETQSLALLCDDPNSAKNPWSHWVLYDLPPDTRALAEGYPPGGTPAPGGKQGRNDFGRVDYGGPCPGSRYAHRYFFQLYALDKTLGLPPGATRAEVLQAMQGHILDRVELMGRYTRRR